MTNHFSKRLKWDAVRNDLSIAIAQRRTADESFIDLTISNPTLVGLDLPTELLAEFLAEAALAPYAPEARGLRSAREAVAESMSRDEEVAPEDIIITASTSEAYSFLFKLLCDPGDNVLVGAPSYPLLESLAALESIELRHFQLAREGRWAIDFDSINEQRDARTRAIVVIHPNNPTGSYVSSEELTAMTALSLPIISDEVFFEFPIERRAEFRSAASSDSGLVFSLGGLSKSAALPHWKLGWIRVGGDETRRLAAVEALESIADTYLSVATPVQVALAQIFAIAPEIRNLIRARAKKNLIALDAHLVGAPEVTRFEVEGGWSVILRIPAIQSDEEFAIGLLRDESVLVQPGYLFDFQQEGYVVLSLITEEKLFSEGVLRTLRQVRKAVG